MTTLPFPREETEYNGERDTATKQANSSVQTDLFAAYVNYLKHAVR